MTKDESMSEDEDEVETLKSDPSKYDGKLFHKIRITLYKACLIKFYGYYIYGFHTTITLISYLLKILV